MIFLTGAAGKTGRAILKSLKKNNRQVLPLVRSEKQASELQALGVFNCLLGDLNNLDVVASRLESVDVFYYICPNVSTDELEIGRNLIRLAKEIHVSHFVYHSVLHPQIEVMPHHWQKMRVEEALFESGLNFTVLQPCAYMQNILGSWNGIKQGTYVTPYAPSARLSIVDLEDIAEVAAAVMGQPAFYNAIFELAGPEPLSQVEVAQALTRELGYPVDALRQTIAEWRQNARQNGMGEPQLTLLQKMFEYYDRCGLVGNPSVLYNLLKRPPTTFIQFLQRTLQTGELQ